MTDLRCRDCQELEIECPLGYLGGPCQCDVCGYKFALTAPACAPMVSCPECKASVTYDPKPTPP